MHKTQQHILGTLLLRTPRRYSELRPENVEGNVFMHHIKKLTEAGLIEKTKEGYGLTPAGVREVTRLSTKTLLPRIQPKILVEIACKNEKDEWLFSTCQIEPFRDMIGFPAGSIHLGETLIEATQRELFDKTGLEAVVSHKGNIYFQTFQDGELISHLLSHVFVGDVTGGELKNQEVFWGKFETTRNYFPALEKVIYHLENQTENGQFFGEYVFRN